MTTDGDRQPIVEETPTVVLPAQKMPAQKVPTHDVIDMAEEEPQPARRRSRIPLIAGAAVLVLAAGAGTAVTYAYRGDVPLGVTVLGAELGGLGRAEAAAELRRHLAADTRLTQPLTVTVDNRDATVKPADVGLVVDVDATIAAAAKGNPSPFGERAVAPVVAVDAELLDEKLRASLGRIGEPMTKPAVVFDGVKPRAVHPAPGRDLVPASAAAAVRAAWPSASTVGIPLEEVHPVTTAAEVDRLLADVATPAVSGPLTITSDKGTVTVPPSAIAKSLVLSADKAGRIEPRIDAKKLRAAITKPLAEVETEAKDAKFSLKGGRPSIVEGADGTAVDLAGMAPEILNVLSRTSGRTIAATVVKAAPSLSGAELGKLGVQKKISTFTTRFTGGLGSSRSQNIVQAAKQVEGALVLPGETFSLNKHTGERSYKQGYKDAPVILGGKLTPGVGGGVSQFTTTLFNATYYAGLKDVEHKPHSYYFDRYPAVIESTIFYPDLDFKFKNDSPYGVLLDTSWTSNSITVSVWSTKVWDKVTTEWSKRRNVTSPRTITLPAGPSCIATGGLPGFTQDAFRLFHRDGEVVKREKFTWKYDAEPNYICGGTPAEDD
ncbi:vanomycin resistance protein VanB [Actinoplanes sp. OR16]|uniref:VanW family protein n=1 Tax=Actinoplanes sp. OR16 TaxID=946334 RepID=UPI000F6FBA15|nr:VanW family protein [Actinoplanes sp. OR16]BBH67373.1 vanomycin resistance protein VanB [Actinoplanes sp. OR16]